MIIAERIYNGENAEDLRMSDIEYQSRKELLDRFLVVWNGDNFTKEYLQWLALQEEGHSNSHEFTGRESLPSAGTMAKNLVTSGVSWAASGFKMVPEQEADRRWNICQQCEYLIGNARCQKCGCWMAFKSKFSGMRCADNRW